MDAKQFDKPQIKEIVSLSIGCTPIYLITPEIYENHKKEFDFLYDILCDDYSKQCLIANLKGRLTGCDIPFPSLQNGDPQYFLSDLMQYKEKECIMDGGAFIGDTAQEFIDKKPHTVKEYKIYSWEPDSANYKVLSTTFQNNPSVIPISQGMYSFTGELHFASGKGEGGTITSQGDITVKVDTIDNIAKDEKVTFIKMDIEGSELEALKGAKEQITKNRPHLAICLYHKLEDEWTIPQYIYSLNPNYKFYLRTHSRMPTELVLHCL